MEDSTTRFAMPVDKNEKKSERYNTFTACLAVNYASNGKLYLYDSIDIKEVCYLNKNVFPVARFDKNLNKYLPYILDYEYIYQSAGLEKHILKRHPECIEYLTYLPFIINHPDYVGVNPHEPGTSFELVKTFDKNVQIGIKLDVKDDYLYVATLHTITDSKLRHGIENGRLKKI